MTQTQNFEIESNGLVKGGTASYTADLSTGEINWNASVEVGVWFVKKNYPFSGKYTVNPNIFLSSNWETVGQRFIFGNLEITVLMVNPTKTQTSAVLVLNGPTSGNGNALIDTLGININATYLSCNVSVAGLSLSLVAKPVDTLSFKKTLGHKLLLWLARS